MSTYTLDELETIRRQADILSIAGEVVKLRKLPDPNLSIGKCPFCGKHNFQIHSKRQLFHCFACHTGGDAFAFIMRTRKLDFASAVEWLKASTDSRQATLY